MQLHVINSNSKGNAYILSNEREALLIECGVRFDRIKIALEHKISKVVGCIVTHEHGDHCKGVGNVLKAGIDVYAHVETHKAMGTFTHHRAKFAVSTKAFKCGSFKILPFAVKHDEAVKGSLGYLINHPECGNVLFMTDLYYTEYVFPNLNNIIIEANYCQEILDNHRANGTAKQFLQDRVIASHMSLQNCKETLLANDLTNVNNIVLIHLSDRNSDAKRFQKEIQQATGKMVYVADAGMAIDFNSQPF